MKKILAAAPLAALLSAGEAAAHHVVDGKMPATWMEGLLSGLAHPVIGLDHLAFIVVVGLVSAFARDGQRIALSFGVALIAGVIVGLIKPKLPQAEVLVALTVLGAGVALVMQKAESGAIWRGLSISAGVLHGYVLAAPLVGASVGPVVFYLVGLVASLLLVLVPVRTFAEMTLLEDRAEQLKLQATGGAVAALGVFYVATALAGV